MDHKQFIDYRNKNLFDFITNKYLIKVNYSHKDTWTFQFNEENIFVGVKKSKYPISCFTHELLHAEIQIQGYKKLRYGTSSLFPDNLSVLMDALDQELQHHKMFSRFIELGFPSNEFYYDNDILILSKLNKFLKVGTNVLLSVLLKYFTVIAPGGTIENKVLSRYREQLKKLNDNCFRKQLDVIDDIFIQWSRCENLDAEPFIRRYFKNIGSPSRTWFGYGTPNEFPNNGFFVDEIFPIF